MKTANTFETTIFGIVIILTIVAIAWMARSIYYNYKQKKNTLISKGFSGKVGDSISLDCPSGMKISSIKGNYIWSGQDTQNCPPIDINVSSNKDYGLFNKNNTIDATPELSDANGQVHYIFDVPSNKKPSGCDPKGDEMFVVGTYTCDI